MKGVFKCAKEDDERRSGSVEISSLEMPPCTSKKYPRRLKRLSLGIPLCIPFSIDNYQFVLRFPMFLSLHALLIRPKLIYNFCLLHACFVWYCYAFDTLSYTFDHIWTNLLTQCTPVPVSVFCYFSNSISPILKLLQKFGKNLIKHQRVRSFEIPEGGPGGHH